jgi:hypothetical protein
MHQNCPAWIQLGAYFCNGRIGNANKDKIQVGIHQGGVVNGLGIDTGGVAPCFFGLASAKFNNGMASAKKGLA